CSGIRALSLLEYTRARPCCHSLNHSVYDVLLPTGFALAMERRPPHTEPSPAMQCSRSHLHSAFLFAPFNAAKACLQMLGSTNCSSFVERVLCAVLNCLQLHEHFHW